MTEDGNAGRQAGQDWMGGLGPAAGPNGGSEKAPGASERVRPLAGEEQARHTHALAQALLDVWQAGTPFTPGGGIDWLVFAHAVEERLITAGATASPAAPFAQVSAVDTAWARELRRRIELAIMGRTAPRAAEQVMVVLKDSGFTEEQRRAEAGDPEAGHTFRLEVHSRGSYGLETDGGGVVHTDAEWLGEPPLTVEVRGWSLKDALRKALGLTLADWSREGHRLGDPPPPPDPLTR